MSFKGDRCEKFFTKGSGGKFLAKNNLKYHKYRAGKGMADDKVGEVKWLRDPQFFLKKSHKNQIGFESPHPPAAAPLFQRGVIYLLRIFSHLVQQKNNSLRGMFL